MKNTTKNKGFSLPLFIISLMIFASVAIIVATEVLL